MKNEQVLIDAYGYVPSFHDARLEVLEFLSIDCVRATFFVYDSPETGKPIPPWNDDLCSRITLRFEDIEEFVFHGNENWLGRAYEQQDGQTVTFVMEFLYCGENSFIKCGAIEVEAFEILMEKPERYFN